MRRLAAAFAVFGAFAGCWAVAAADIEHALRLSHAGFGILLSCALAGAAVTNAIGSTLVDRRGAPRVLGASLLTWAALLLLGAVFTPRLVLGAAVVGVFTVGGLVDVVMNVVATTALPPGRLVQFHALFNGGAALGAVTTGIVLASDASWRSVWLGIALLATIPALLAFRGNLPGGATGESSSVGAAITMLRRERLGLVAIVFATAAMVEGGIDLWGVLFLRTFLDSGIGLAAASSTAGFAVATVARVVVGPRAARRGAGPGVIMGGTVATLGILLLAATDNPWVSAIGLVLGAGGISLCWPLLLSFASADRERPALVIGGITGVGYLGFVFGPTVVGWISAAAGLRWGLVALAVGAAFVTAGPVLGRRTPLPSQS